MQMKVNWKEFPRRVVQYFGGLVVMAMGVVLMKRVDLGISPITAVPAAISAITPFTLGNMTTFLHAVCVVGQILIVRRVTLKSILRSPGGFAFPCWRWGWRSADWAYSSSSARISCSPPRMS